MPPGRYTRLQYPADPHHSDPDSLITNQIITHAVTINHDGVSTVPYQQLNVIVVTKITVEDDGVDPFNDKPEQFTSHVIK